MSHGGTWNSESPKICDRVAITARACPRPSRGVRGHAPPENFENCDAQICIFQYFGYNFRKIRERICKVICTYIYNIYKIFEVTGKIRKIKKKMFNMKKSCVQRSTQQHSSWMFIPICRHHFFKIQLYVLVDIQVQQCIQAPLRHHAAVV